MKKYQFNKEIPNTMGDAALEHLAILASKVPENGIIVEVGSLFGCSTWVLAKNSLPSVKVYAIDPWVREPWIIKLEEKYNAEIEFSLDAFKHYTKDCENVFPIQGYSPEIVSETWNQNIDLFFEDSTHSNPVLTKNFNFFIPFVKENGIIAGDDYNKSFIDVVKEVDLLTQKHSQSLFMNGTLWAIKKNTSNKKLNRDEEIDNFIHNHKILSKADVESYTGVNYRGLGNSWGGAVHKYDPIKKITINLINKEKFEYDLKITIRYKLSDDSITDWILEGNDYVIPENLHITSLEAKLIGKDSKKFRLEYQCCYINNDGEFQNIIFKQKLQGNSKSSKSGFVKSLGDKTIVSAVKIDIKERVDVPAFV